MIKGIESMQAWTLHMIKQSQEEKLYMTLALEANHLGKKYGKRWALQNCDLHIPRGE
ncbi:hypothetical protein KSD_85260 [Ktedonobacter sp. SOSP1-85]|nr:hypothetical protein KSD_85260 [Ktedonobacter sp. SOSP1-85]